MKKLGRCGPASEQHEYKARRRSLFAAHIDYTLEHRRNEAHTGDAIGLETVRDALRIEVFVDHDTGSDERTPHKHGQAPDVKERHTQKPSIVALMT